MPRWTSLMILKEDEITIRLKLALGKLRGSEHWRCRRSWGCLRPWYYSSGNRTPSHTRFSSRRWRGSHHGEIHLRRWR